MSKLHVFETDVKDHEDCGRWRSYDLEAEGATLDELLESAVYWQTDQDGGSMGSIGADDDLAVQIITDKFAQWSLAK